MSIDSKIKSGIALVIALCICFGLGGCGKKNTNNEKTSEIVSLYNNDFETSNLPSITKKEADEINFNSKITYYDIVKIIEDVYKDTDTLSLAEYLKAMKAEEAYNEYIVARKNPSDLKKVRKALGKFEERVLKSHILQLYGIDPLEVENVKISDEFFMEYDHNGENYEGQVITITFKERKVTTTKPGGIVEEDIIKPEKETIYLSIFREQLKRINKLKDGKKYDIEEIDEIMYDTLNVLYCDSSSKHFKPTEWGSKDFYYLVYEINEEVYKKVKALSYELEQDEIITKTSKKDQLLELKRQAEYAKTAYKQQSLKYTKNVSTNIPRRI